MYALGLVASFTINMGSLLIYRYFTGTKEIRAFNTSRVRDAGPLHHPAELPSSTSAMSKAVRHRTLAGGHGVLPDRRVPRREEACPGDRPGRADRQSAADGVRPGRGPRGRSSTSTSSGRWKGSTCPIRTWPSSPSTPRGRESRTRLAPNHYRFAQSGQSLFDSITELLYVLKYELPHKQITIHIGWPRLVVARPPVDRRHGLQHDEAARNVPGVPLRHRILWQEAELRRAQADVAAWGHHPRRRGGAADGGTHCPKQFLRLGRDVPILHVRLRRFRTASGGHGRSSSSFLPGTCETTRRLLTCEGGSGRSARSWREGRSGRIPSGTGWTLFPSRPRYRAGSRCGAPVWCARSVIDRGDRRHAATARPSWGCG